MNMERDGGTDTPTSVANAVIRHGSSAPQEPKSSATRGSIGEQRGSVRRVLVPALIVLTGVLVILYPVFSTQWNNIQQQRVAAEYSKYAAKADPKLMEAAIERAHQYNETRTSGPILDPWLARVSADNPNYQDYLSQLNLSGVMATLIIPSIHLNLPVFHGTSPDVLSRGVGHLYGTDLPVGGSGTHAVLTGHTGLPTATLFDNLTKVKVGDSIFVQVYDQKMRYVVTSTEVVLPDQVASLGKAPGKDLLTLVTCTPYGINSHRLLVHAQREPVTDEAARELSAGTGLNLPLWMLVFMGVAILSLAGIAVWAIRQHRATRSSERNETSSAPRRERHISSSFGHDDFGSSTDGGNVR